MDCCEKIVQRICDELADDINGELCEKLKEHVKECKDCRDQLSTMKSAVHLFQCLEDKQVPLDVHERLLTMLNVPTSV